MVLRLISIHALREEGDHITSTVKYTAAQISIHALREEGDSSAQRKPVSGQNFYPRPPRGGRLDTETLYFRGTDFYPRPPRGGRRTTAVCLLRASKFLSTPSARRATKARARRQVVPRISIHALREEGDVGGAGRQPTKDISIHALREEGDILYFLLCSPL